MNKEDMVVGKEYLNADKGDKNLYVYNRHGIGSAGQFEDKDGDLYHILYSRMTEAPAAKPEFELDDEIEIGFNSIFDDSIATFKGKFKHLDPSGPYWIVDKDGFMRCGDFARKVEPMIRISEYGEMEYWEITQAHMDKIKAGEFK